MKEKHKNKKVSLIAVALVIILLPVLGVLVIRMERETPQIEIDLASSQFGVERNLAITVSDKKSGLKSLWIGILKDGQEVVLLEKEFPASGWLKKGSVNRKPINISVKPKELGLKDGNGMLRMVVTDYSWRGWGKGNRTYIEQQINI
ncbi:MAG: hypothetical protein JRE12_18865, partial [Deltaproteobacteria bacterium]|nr:hypothetical protein [Deltaproteobacteria bacterium]